MVQIRHSVCALDCPDACALLINVEDGRGSRLRGDPDHPVTRGFLCAKVARYLEREYSPARLLYPMRRTGAKGEGRFERVSWNDALDEIAARLTELAATHGPECILPYSYAGTMGFLQGSGMDRRFFHRLGASRLDRTICSSAGTAGLTRTQGVRYGTEPEQFAESRLIIAWGANILGTNVHLWPFIQEAKRKGARLYVIEPVANRTAKVADKWFGIYPGSDLALAFGLMHVILRENLHDQEYVSRYTSGFDSFRRRAAEYPPERVAALTGIPAEEIVTLAREYAAIRPSAIRLNYGVQRSERGGAAVAAISMLPALIGSWREVGGGLLFSTSQAFQVNRTALERPDLTLLGRPARLVNMAELGRSLTELDDPKVMALVVYNSNPAAIAPDQNRVVAGLRRPDLFTVVLEQFQTDTADYADIVLPVTTFLEHTDVYFAYGHYYLQMARPALPAPGETKSNLEIFRELARRMGFTEPCFRDSEDKMIRQLLSSGHPFLNGITLEEIEQRHSVRLNLPAPFQPFAEGRINLDLDGIDYTPPVESRLGDEGLRARYPLELITPKIAEGMNSTFGNRPGVDQETGVLSMSGGDAAPRGISAGDNVRVFNMRGSIVLRAEVNGKVRAGVVSAASVRWNKRAPDKRNVNVLTSSRLTDMGGGPVFYSCLVEVERCGD